MNFSTAAVRFDDGAVRIELSDGAAAVPEQGSSVCLRKDCGPQHLWAAIPKIGGVDFFFLKI
jgi:hypothetical protein